MRTRLVSDTELPGGFVIEAENPAEVLILRMFCNDKRPIRIANFGGNIGDNRYSFMITHSSEKEPGISPEIIAHGG